MFKQKGAALREERTRPPAVVSVWAAGAWLRARCREPPALLAGRQAPELVGGAVASVGLVAGESGHGAPFSRQGLNLSLQSGASVSPASTHWALDPSGGLLSCSPHPAVAGGAFPGEDGFPSGAERGHPELGPLLPGRLSLVPAHRWAR